MKQLMAGGGVALIGITLVTLLSGLFGCIVFTIIQHTWNFMAILIAMEVFLMLVTAGAGVIEAVLEVASDSLGGFMRS